MLILQRLVNRGPRYIDKILTQWAYFQNSLWMGLGFATISSAYRSANRSAFNDLNLPTNKRLLSSCLATH